MVTPNRNDMRAEKQRKRLLALIASQVAGGMAAAAGFGTEERNERIAQSAVDVAERIIRRVGL